MERVLSSSSSSSSEGESRSAVWVRSGAPGVRLSVEEPVAILKKRARVERPVWKPAMTRAQGMEVAFACAWSCWAWAAR